MLLENFLYELVSNEDEFIQVWDCNKREYVYEGKRGDIGKFCKEHICRYYLHYYVVNLTPFSESGKIGLNIDIDKRRWCIV